MSGNLYTWLKALHVAAAFTFFAGVLGAAVFLAGADAASAGALRAMRSWGQRVTTHHAARLACESR